MKTIKGPAIYLAQFLGDKAPFDNLDNLATWAAKLGYDSRALADADSVAEGPLRELWAARNKGWVGESELAEINRLLFRLNDLLHRPRSAKRGRLVALTWVLAPVDAKPARRAPRTTR